jgi:hypothetical protein
MLVKVNKICKYEKRVQATLLDIDDLSSIIPVRELDLRISPSHDSITETPINSPYAAIITEGNNNEDNGIIVIANAITLDEINREKTKTMDRVSKS